MEFLELAGRFILAGLAVWRMSHFVANEKGPFRAVEILRHSNWGKTIGVGFDCFSCVSVWMSVLFSVFVGGVGWSLAVVIPALSGFSMLLERVVSNPVIVQEIAMPRSYTDELLQTDASDSDS
ncbi:hypothetical protein FJ950_27040 [Mesorhizobium sp. B2-3-14]|uniref:hypothetical protein n=1 Tax=Mesorhizobium sp. B2-3-14 TaxID=2589950 RepID=UPI00112B3F75|nr:hypothetical protein [Mesorhizobium sp. B2-3-14]TPL79873.1 hypothetical protein FJ950_27040 [Mesorhizobium sp. B2-3-14]